MSDYFPTTGQAAHLEQVLQRIAQWPEDSAINLRVVAKEALENYRRQQVEHYLNYEVRRRDRHGIDWA